MKSIPCCKLPMTTLFVDDDESLQIALSLNLSSKDSRYKFFTDPIEALSHIRGQRSIFENGPVGLSNNGSLVKPEIQFRLADMEKLALVPYRFGEIENIVVDYQMCRMNGLELLEQIKLPHVEKILLTGVADEEIGLEAYSRRLIHNYIRKHDPDMPNLLKAALARGRESFFARVTRFVNEAVSCDKNGTALTDPAFQEFFWKIRGHLGAVEHYLFDAMGGFLFLDQHACATRLYTFSEGQIQHLADSPEARQLPRETFGALARGEQILCYANPDGAHPPGEFWPKYLHRAWKVKGRENYYCALVPEYMNANVDQIVPFTRKSPTPCLTTISDYAYL
jgi:CheY-like chemotaxis protein